MFLQGVLLGLSLSFLAGPLLFAIVQAGVERGFRAGVAVACGIWVSDILYVLLVSYGVNTLAAVTTLPGFRFWAGLAGAVLLVVFGAFNWMDKKARTAEDHDSTADRLLEAWEGTRKPGRRDWRTLGLPAYWLRGFVLNTVNPFTVFFWLGITSAVIVPNNWNSQQSLAFFGALLGTLMFADTLKAYAARQLGTWLTPAHTRRLQKAIGILLVVSGMILMYRVL